MLRTTGAAHAAIKFCLPGSRCFHVGFPRRASAKPYYVTTPLFYVNAGRLLFSLKPRISLTPFALLRSLEPHIGHLHSLVLADVFVRFKRFEAGSSAPKALLLTGTDENGMKIQKAAEAKGVTPRELCDSVSQRFEVCTFMDLCSQASSIPHP